MRSYLNFFKDKTGRIVIAQTPNSPLIGYIIFTLLDYLWGSNPAKIHVLFNMISFGFIFTWAWLEIISGVNCFRRTLGLIVLGVVIWMRFQAWV